MYTFTGKEVLEHEKEEHLQETNSSYLECCYDSGVYTVYANG